ncbi:diaminopimelate decarboxylase, partial [Kocuria sp. ZOR0020]|uniref:diaminopimelate decarboxylase n=1 Tax=Kocuria sp. ZOR0020 TaxID=1339234 RepID=UPI000646042C
MTQSDLRQAVHGEPALPARLEPWMSDLLTDPDTCASLLTEYGSPVNVHNFSSLQRNALEMVEAADRHGVDLRVFVARKANKTVGLVDAVRDLGHGIDVGSHRELTQVLERGMPAERIILTAAVKTRELLHHALTHRVPVALDNLDETTLALQVSGDAGVSSPAVLRLAPEVRDGLTPTRFGERSSTWLNFLDSQQATDIEQRLPVVGVHFHLHGYAPQHRTTALGQAIDLVDQLRARGHRVEFIDMGGGVPMSYIDDAAAWSRFGDALHHEVLRGDDSLTWRGDGLGLYCEDHDDGPRVTGQRDTYPYHQELVRGEWLESVLEGEVAPGVTAAEALRQRGLSLHCEPGRSMLDGCGLTLARVAFRKHTSDDVAVVGLEMNRTQCRSTSADFLVDPILVRTGETGSAETGVGSHGSSDSWSAPDGAFLVGAYCIEAELILKRRLHFPRGVNVGDVIALPNTAGYLMHILESASHQIPLATNVVASGAGFIQDAIDTW